MDKEKVLISVKRVTCVLLLSSVAVIFLPYADAGDYYGLFSPVQMIQDVMEHSWNAVSDIVEIVMDFIVPAVLVFIAGLLLIGKIRVAKCVIAFVLSALTLPLYMHYFTSNYLGGMHGKETVGFWLNFALAIIGIVMPMALLILSKKTTEKKERQVNPER